MNFENSINKIKKNDYVFSSKQSAPDCLLKLESSLVSSIFSPLANFSFEKSLKPIFFGRVSGNSFFVQYVKPFFRNDSSPIFSGYIEQKGNGALIYGKFSNRNKFLIIFSSVFLIFWFFICTLIGAYILLLPSILIFIIFFLLTKLSNSDSYKKRILDFLQSELGLVDEKI